jgi:hypothetical protein
MTKEKAIADCNQKVNDNYTVTMCENGFVVEVSGEKDGENWVTTKWIVSDLDGLKSLVQDLAWTQRV